MRSFVHAGVSRTQAFWPALVPGVVATALASRWAINPRVQVVHVAADAVPRANAYTCASQAGQPQNLGAPSGSGICEGSR